MSHTVSILLLMKLGSNMTSRIRSRHSRSPRGPNDIQYQLAQFPCGTHNPMERERVCREIQPADIDFGDPHIACKERVIPENWQSAHQRTNEPDTHIQYVNAFSPRTLAVVHKPFSCYPGPGLQPGPWFKLSLLS